MTSTLLEVAHCHLEGSSIGGHVRAVWLEEFGGPEVLVLRDTPDPVAGPGQVTIDVSFANLTFVETQFRATGAGPMARELPMVPGNGVGGTVSAIGAGVDERLLGTPVVTSTGGSGGYAERVAVDASGLFAVPPGLGLDVAVALLADGRTAMALVRSAGIVAGDRVLVEAAAGGVGTLLVQLARAAGARVIGAAGGARKVALVRAMGAEAAVDYRLDGWTALVRDAVGGLDVVFDGVGGTIGRSAFDLLDRGGRMVSYGLASGEWAAVPEEIASERGLRLLGLPRLTVDETRTLTESVLTEAATERLRVVIGQRFPLERAADAHAAMQSRATVGKTLLVVGRD